MYFVSVLRRATNISTSCCTVRFCKANILVLQRTRQTDRQTDIFPYVKYNVQVIWVLIKSDLCSFDSKSKSHYLTTLASSHSGK